MQSLPGFFVLHAGARRKAAKKAPGRVLTDPALRDLWSFLCYIPAPAEKRQKRRPDGFLLIQPCEASVVVFALPASTEGNCLSLAKRGEFARMDANKACENDRKRSRWIGRTRPGAVNTGGRREYRTRGAGYSVMEANSCRNAEFQ